MRKFNPVIAVVGAGAVGGYYGGRLAQHGYNVHFLLRRDYAFIREHGWSIRSFDGDFFLPPQSLHVYERPADMPAADLVLIALKSTANDQFEALIRPLLKDSTVLLTLQNGLGIEDELARQFGKQRILGGMAFVCINRTGPGVIEHTDYGVVRIGEYEGGPSPRLRDIAEMFNASAIRCEMLGDLRHGRWQKLVWNVPFNGLGALLDKATDELLGSEAGTALIRALMEEVVATSAAKGVILPDGTIDEQINRTRTMGAYLTSMQVDRRERRPMEVEAIFGQPLRTAQAAGIQTPHLQMLYGLLSVINHGFTET